jgi:hypothetical protein
MKKIDNIFHASLIALVIAVIVLGLIFGNAKASTVALDNFESAINSSKDTRANCSKVGADIICEVHRIGDPVYHFENLMFIRNSLADIQAEMKQNGFKGKLIVKEGR